MSFLEEEILTLIPPEEWSCEDTEKRHPTHISYSQGIVNLACIFYEDFSLILKETTLLEK